MIQKIIDRIRQRRIDSQERELQAHIRIVERNGRFWLTCYGIAIRQYPENATLNDVHADLREMRGIAVDYARTHALTA